jgi:glutamine cyclotransferase
MVKFTYYFALLLFLVAILSYGCSNNTSKVKIRKKALDIPQINFTIVNHYPHDIVSFTEGLLFHDNKLFESTGSPIEFPQAKSVVGFVSLETGIIDKKIELDKNKYFGEGIVFLNNKLYQLTYKNQVCFVYDAKTFKKQKSYSYQNKEGWGLTTDGTHIIMSDGTNVISFRDSSNFDVVRQLAVSSNNYAIDYLNELEFINGYIYANVWPSNIIVKINPTSGKVVGKIDLTLLRDLALVKNSNSYETNGIAYDSILDKIYVTGKMWADIYQIDFVH